MKSCRLLLLTAALLTVVSSVGATKYYFNSFDNSSTADWTAKTSNPLFSKVGLYKWAGGSYGYEMMGANHASGATGTSYYTTATPSAPVAQDFWFGADFRHTGGYAESGSTSSRAAYQFFVNSAGAGIGVYASMDRSSSSGEVGLCWVDNYMTLPAGQPGKNLIKAFGTDIVLDPSDYNECRVQVDFNDVLQVFDVYFNGNLMREWDMLDMPGGATPPDGNIVRNFTKVATWFYQPFTESTYGSVSIDNIWCGSVANPYQNAHLLPGDVNGDLTVDVVDLGILATNWKKGNATWNGALDSAITPGTKIMGWNAGDSNGDGTVDVVDLGILATNWKKSIAAPVQPTPEPASMALLAIAGLGVLARRRK